MNYVKDKNRFQVDTGPVLFPDLKSESDQDIQKLNLAFVCYNNRNIAEFVSRVPSILNDNKGNKIETMEYSQIDRVNVKTRLFACTNE